MMRRLVSVIVVVAAVACVVVGQEKTVTWTSALKQKADWYASPDALRIADNLLLYQRDSGGWPKNIDMARALNASEHAALTLQKKETDSTIDNGSTYSQLIFLARVYQAAPHEQHRDAFIRGLDYLLAAQYENGGWPQFYPDLTGYYKHITFNDGAMIGVMKLLRDVAAGKSSYSFVDAQRREKCRAAVAKGIECILKTQIVVHGQLTVWCAQHDERTLAPAPARKYELVSLSGGESVDIVRFLMSIDKPDSRVVTAIESAIAWFQKSKIDGIRWIEKPDASQAHGFDRVVIRDSTAPPLWARFYDIETNRPIFVGRDGVVKYDVAEIEGERRNGYNWYVSEPAELLNKDYPAWQKKVLLQKKQTATDELKRLDLFLSLRSRR